MRKAQQFSRLAQIVETGNTSFFAGDQAVDLLAQPRPNGFVRPGNVFVTFLVRDDIDQNQACRRRGLLIGEHIGVERGLSLEPLQSFLGEEVVEIHRKMHGLDLVDPQRAVIVKNYSIGASGDLYGPAVDIELDVGRHLARESGLGDLEIALDPAVELGTDPKAGQAGPGQTDGPLFRLAEEVAHSCSNRPPLCVDDDGHDCLRRRWMK